MSLKTFALLALLSGLFSIAPQPGFSQEATEENSAQTPPAMDPTELLRNSLENDRAFDAVRVDAVEIKDGVAKVSGAAQTLAQQTKLKEAALGILQGYVKKNQIPGPITSVDVTGVKLPPGATPPMPPMQKPPVQSSPNENTPAPKGVLAKALQDSLPQIEQFQDLKLLATEIENGTVVLYGTVSPSASTEELEQQALVALNNTAEKRPEVQKLGPFREVDASHLRSNLLNAIQEMISRDRFPQLRVHQFDGQTQTIKLLGRVNSSQSLFEQIVQIDDKVKLDTDDVIVARAPKAGFANLRYGNLVGALRESNSNDMLANSAFILKFAPDDSSVTAKTWYIRAIAHIINGDIEKAKATLSIAQSLDQPGQNSIRFTALEPYQGAARSKLEELLVEVQSNE